MLAVRRNVRINHPRSVFVFVTIFIVTHEFVAMVRLHVTSKTHITSHD